MIQELEDEVDQANLNLIAFNHVLSHARRRIGVGCDAVEWQ
jgi:hypothetical protein